MGKINWEKAVAKALRKPPPKPEKPKQKR